MAMAKKKDWELRVERSVVAIPTTTTTTTTVFTSTGLMMTFMVCCWMV